MRRDEVGCLAWAVLRAGVFDGSRSISSQLVRLCAAWVSIQGGYRAMASV